MIVRHIRTSCLGLALSLGLLFILPARALACSLDGIASLSVNGSLASLNGSAPTGTGLAHWAPFALDAAAPGTRLHFAEDLGKVRRTLPTEAFEAPFRWTFGDGTTTSGRDALHRYARTGWYTVTVSYYWASQHRWLEFDRAEEPIVAAGALWRPPAAAVAMGQRIVTFGAIAALALAAAGGLLVRTRRGPWRAPVSSLPASRGELD